MKKAKETIAYRGSKIVGKGVDNYREEHSLVILVTKFLKTRSDSYFRSKTVSTGLGFEEEGSRRLTDYIQQNPTQP